MGTQSAQQGHCLNCRHFCNEPAYLEREIPGLSSMSSAYASVRAQDGLCSLHQRYLPANSGCQQFEVTLVRE